MKYCLVILILLLALEVPGLAANKWDSSIPLVAKRSETWKQLSAKLIDNHYYFGALAASHRMLRHFSDIGSKEFAYQTIIELLDRGYPFPMLDVFATADFDPKPGTDFFTSFTLYKGKAHEERRNLIWSQTSLGKLGDTESPKVWLSQAIDKYVTKDLPAAKELLNKILSTPNLLLSLAAKAARTLARIHFEEKEYGKSLDIYLGFLLKMPSVTSTDWLEAAWNLYYLKRYEESLGFLYNLEAPETQLLHIPEKYVLRAFIYRDNCAADPMSRLLTTYEDQYRESLAGIRKGIPLAQIKQLRTLQNDPMNPFHQISYSLEALQKESSQLDSLPGSLRPLAKHLYSSEINLLRNRQIASEETSLKELASELITLQEGLKLMQYEVTRELLNPEYVFQEKENKLQVKDSPTSGFLVEWPQSNEFWRNERHKYRANLTNQCHI